MSPINFSFTLTDTSLILFVITLGVYIHIKYFSTHSPLVHPLLLQKQSEVSQIRKDGYSGMYRNWATGAGGVLSNRPSSGVKNVADLLLKSEGTGLSNEHDESSSRPRWIMGHQVSNKDLRGLAKHVASGISAAFPFDANSADGTTGKPPHIIILTTRARFQVLLLHLARALFPSSFHLTVLSDPLCLQEALKSSSAAKATSQDIVVIDVDQQDALKFMIDEDVELNKGVRKRSALVLGAAKGQGNDHETVTVVCWDEMMAAAYDSGHGTQHEQETESTSITDSHCTAFIPAPKPLSSKPKSKNSDDPVIEVKLTNENITAGVAATLSLFPANKRPSPASRDVLVTSEPIYTPFGISLMFMSLYSVTGYEVMYPDDPKREHNHPGGFLGECKRITHGKKERQPTLAFITSPDLKDLVVQLDKKAKSHPAYDIAVAHKRQKLADGHVARQGLMDKVVWNGVRAHDGGLASSLRGVVVIGDAPTQTILTHAQVLLSLPIIRLQTSPFCAGPVFVSHFNDVQALPVMASIEDGAEPVTHSGPPSVNVEVLLRGDEVDSGDAGNDPEGELGIRGPSVLIPQNSSLKATQTQKAFQVLVDDQGFLWTGEHARALTNGTFVV